MIHTGETALAGNWTSLREETGKMTDRNPLCAALINHLLVCLEIFTQAGLSPFIEEWQSADYLANREIALMHGKAGFMGQFAALHRRAT